MGIRTPDLLNAIEALYQLSYDPLNLGGLIISAFPDNARDKNALYSKIARSTQKGSAETFRKASRDFGEEVTRRLL